MGTGTDPNEGAALSRAILEELVERVKKGGIKEIILATRLEFKASKDKILAYYSSHAPFGGNVVGLDAASWRYFNRNANDLSWAENATLQLLAVRALRPSNRKEEN